MIKMPNDIDFTYQEKRSDKTIWIDNLFQSYLSDCRAYKEVSVSKNVWLQANQEFVDKNYLQNN
tara:strand:- start:1380 stop:1571 length:192 start_codon:yes stop_codon:yes gene_type:complete